MSFVTVKRDTPHGAKQTSLNAGFGFPASMQGEPGCRKRVAGWSTGLFVMLPVPGQPFWMSEYSTFNEPAICRICTPSRLLNTRLSL